MPKLIEITHDSTVAKAVAEYLNSCQRAWRDTPHGKQWYWLVPADVENQAPAGQTPS